MKDFRDLKVWEKSHKLTLEIYRLTKQFPTEEKYGLVSQLRRCSASIAANIAEGCGKRGHGEFNRFLQMAAGSTKELDYHLLLSRDLEYLTDPHYKRVLQEVIEVRKMLASLIRKVEADKRGHAEPYSDDC